MRQTPEERAISAVAAVRRYREKLKADPEKYALVIAKRTTSRKAAEKEYYKTESYKLSVQKWNAVKKLRYNTDPAYAEFLKARDKKNRLLKHPPKPKRTEEERIAFRKISVDKCLAKLNADPERLAKLKASHKTTREYKLLSPGYRDLLNKRGRAWRYIHKFPDSVVAIEVLETLYQLNSIIKGKQPWLQQT